MKITWNLDKIFKRQASTQVTGERKRGRLPTLRLHGIAILALLLAFGISLLMFFPMGVIADRVENQLRAQGVDLNIGDLSFAPPLALVLRQISWQPPTKNWPAVTIPQARLTPLWGSLASSSPGMRLQARLTRGQLEGQLRGNGAQLTLRGVALSPFVPQGFNYPIEGLLSGNFTAASLTNAANAEGNFVLTLDQLSVSGLEAVGAGNGTLSLGRVQISGGWQGNNLRIDEIRNDNGDILLQGRATLLMGQTAATSRISAQLDLTPAATLDPALRDLLLLTGVSPDPAGVYRLRISGSLASPVLR